MKKFLLLWITIVFVVSICIYCYIWGRVQPIQQSPTEEFQAHPPTVYEEIAGDLLKLERKKENAR